MSLVQFEPWRWLVVGGLGFYHGINPAMGWLFAVALGLHRQSRRTVLLALLPITLGHAAAVALALAAVLALGSLLDPAMLRRIAAAILIGWAMWHAVRGHRQRLRVGMQTGLAGLALWSFLMANAHGAGLMLIPVTMPICLAASPTGEFTGAGSLPIAFAALGVHTAVILATIAMVSIAVYEWVGLAFLRSAWVNFDLIWIAALGAGGVFVMLG
jgi:hypothetical protein